MAAASRGGSTPSPHHRPQQQYPLHHPSNHESHVEGTSSSIAAYGSHSYMNHGGTGAGQLGGVGSSITELIGRLDNVKQRIAQKAMGELVSHTPPIPSSCAFSSSSNYYYYNYYYYFFLILFFSSSSPSSLYHVLYDISHPHRLIYAHPNTPM